MGTLAKIFLSSLDWRTKALCGNFGKDFPAILRLSKKSSTWELWQRFFCHPWIDEQKLYVGTLAKIFLPSLDWRTKALRGNFGKDFPAILGLTNKSSTWELWQRFSCHPWTDEQKLYVGTLAKIFLPSFDCRTKALCKNIGKDFPAIFGLMNGKDFPAILGLTNKKLYVETLAKIFLPSLDCRMAKIFLPSLDCQTKALRGNIGKDFPAILGLTNEKLYVGTLAKIFLPSLDWRRKALRGNFGKDFPAILGLTNKSSTNKSSLDYEQKLGTLAKIFLPSLDCRMAKIFLPSLDWRTKALCGNIGKDFPAILGLTNKSSMWELWQRFSCHPWTDEQKLYVGTLAKIFLPSLDWRTKALRGNFGKDFPAILGLTNKSSTWELWQRFSCHPWTDEQKLYVGTLAKIFLPSLDWRTKALRGNFGKDFPAILGLTNKSSTWELWQRFSCHPWTDEQKLYVGTLAKIFLPSLDWRMAKIFLPSLDCRTKALCKNIGKDFPAILGLMNGKDFPAILGLTNKKLYVETLAKIFLPSFGMAKIFLPSLDCQTKALRGNIGKDFPAILGLTNKSSTWELWQRFSCHPWTDEQKLYVGTLAKIFLPSLDWRTKALRGNFGKDFPAILGLTNKSSMWELWQRFSCHPWTVEQKLYVRTLAKIFLPSLDWWMAKIFLPSLDWRTKSSMWKHWQRFSCHP